MLRSRSARLGNWQFSMEMVNFLGDFSRYCSQRKSCCIADTYKELGYTFLEKPCILLITKIITSASPGDSYVLARPVILKTTVGWGWPVIGSAPQQWKLQHSFIHRHAYNSTCKFIHNFTTRYLPTDVNAKLLKAGKVSDFFEQFDRADVFTMRHLIINISK